MSILTGTFAVLLALIPLAGMYLFWIPAVVTLVFAFVSLRHARRFRLRPGNAVAGLVLGIVSFAITGFWLALSVIIPAIADHGTL